MEKIIIKNEIFRLSKETEIRWKDIKHIEFQDNDVIMCYSDDEGDSFWANIWREELETDEQFEKRKKSYEKIREASRKKRYETYLILKEEFENLENEEDPSSPTEGK